MSFTSFTSFLHFDISTFQTFRGVSYVFGGNVNLTMMITLDCCAMCHYIVVFDYQKHAIFQYDCFFVCDGRRTPPWSLLFGTCLFWYPRKTRRLWNTKSKSFFFHYDAFLREGPLQNL
jgi:hypothetical protein